MYLDQTVSEKMHVYALKIVVWIYHVHMYVVFYYCCCRPHIEDHGSCDIKLYEVSMEASSVYIAPLHVHCGTFYRFVLQWQQI